MLTENNLSASCPREHRLELSYDFEGFGPNRLELDMLDSPDCNSQASTPAAYCKGSVMRDLRAID